MCDAEPLRVYETRTPSWTDRVHADTRNIRTWSARAGSGAVPALCVCVCERYWTHLRLRSSPSHQSTNMRSSSARLSERLIRVLGLNTCEYFKSHYMHAQSP